jgi:putative heme-binding domain-containing protein
MLRQVIALVVCMGIALAQRSGADDEVHNPFEGDEQAIEAGRKLYLTSCSGCHGPNGEGGRGPRIAQNRRIRGANNRRLFESIQNGIAGSDMPPFPFPDEKVWQVVTYVRNVNAPAYETKVAGNPETGKTIFHGKGGCTGCHMIGGKGGMLGPDLSHIGMTRSVPQLQEAVFQPGLRPTDGFAGVTVKQKNGAVIKGIAKNNTNYSIQVLDSDGKLHLLNKADLSEIIFRKGSLMPEDYGKRLTRQEQSDLIAFLSRQAVRLPIKENDSKGVSR